MATNFKLKRSSVASKRPGLTNLELGELALNTYDGFLFTERNGLGITTVTNLTPWYENYGAGSIFYTNKVGIGTTAVPDANQLLVKGGTETDRLNVTGISTHVGIATFNDALFYDNVTLFGTNPNASSNKILFNKSANLLRFFDSTKADFGQSGDLQIYHLGGINYIDCTTSAQLLIQSDDLHIRNAAGNQEIITTAVNGDVKLFYSGNQKLATTVGGINVTGTTDTDNFINAGVSTFVGIITASQTQNVIPFYYANVSDFPSSSAYHGAFAHAHNTGKAYFAHAGWKEIVSKEADGTIGVGTEQVRVGVTTVTDFNATGNVTLGDADTDNIVFTGEINSNVIPNTNIAYDLGSSTKRWGNLFINKITGGGGNTVINDDITTRNLSVTGLSTFTGNIDANGNLDVDGDTTLDATTVDGLLDINAGGQANTFKVEDLTAGRVVLAGTGGELEDSANLTFNGSNLTVGGNVIAVDGTFSGNVSVAGTLTYQDVTNVDSVGIATARVGLDVLSGGINAVGIVTADGLDAIGIQSGGVNITTGIITAINFTGTGNTVTYDSSTKIVSVSVGGAGGSGTGGKFVENNTGIHTLSNVGIGTTNASDKLKVLGDVAFTGALKVSPLGLSGSSGNYLKSVGTGVTWAAFPTARTVGLQTATANQTSFSFAYNVGFLDVYINGVKLTTNEFTATNGTSVVLTEGAFVGDQVQFISFNTTASGSGGGGGISNVVEDSTPQLGGNLDLNSKIINGSGNIDYTGNFKASGIATATTFVGNLTGNVTGTATEATNVTVSANNTTNETVYPVFVDGATGTQGAETDTGLTYNPSTGNLTATKFSGDGSSITGISTSNITNYGVGLGGGGGVSLSGSTNNTVATVTGANALIGEANLTFDGSTLAVNSSTHEKLILSGSANPYIRFQEGTTNKAYIQWSSAGYFQFVNTESGEILRIKDGNDGLIYDVGGTENKVFHAGNDGSGSGLDADTLDGQEGSHYTNAANLTGTLPAISGANLTNLPAANLTGTLPAISGANLTGIAVTEAPVTDYTITANGSSAYRFAGGGVNSSSNNPDLYLVRGQKYRFNNTTGSSHPFAFRDSANGADYTSGISGSQNGIQFFTVPLDAPALLKYRCTIHTSNMVGNIYIRGAGGHETNVGFTTFANKIEVQSSSNTTATFTGSGGAGFIAIKDGDDGTLGFIGVDGGDLLFQTPASSYATKLTIKSDGNVGIGTVDPTASNITTALSTNTKSLAVGIVTCNELFVSGIKVTSGGHYADLTAAAADGMSHYFPGSSTTALISNLTPSGSVVGNPTVNNTADSYFNNYPYFDFYSGNAAENGYRYLQTTTKWGNGPFTIAFWAKPMSSTLESESTFVQLGDHPSGTLRCLYTVSTDQNRQIKTITIGDDSSALNTAVLTTDWNHWVTTYDGSVTRYYLNGSLARSHTHSGTLDVGTGNKYFWIGFGFWNASITNKASMSHMSDIGIWNAKALSAATISSIYNAKRTVVGY